MFSRIFRNSLTVFVLEQKSIGSKSTLESFDFYSQISFYLFVQKASQVVQVWNDIKLSKPMFIFFG